MNKRRGTVSVLSCASLVCGLVLLASPTRAQVQITEVQPNPDGDDAAEWIELQNTGELDTSIAGLRIHDYGPTSPKIYAFDPGAQLTGHQIIVVARSAEAYRTMAMAAGFTVVDANFELAEGSDDPSVPNLSIVEGTSALQLGNSGDAVVLTDTAGVIRSSVEWGTDRTEVPGSPFIPSPGSGQSLTRIAGTGDSSTDFEIADRPTPGESGSSGPSGPSISDVRQLPTISTYGGTTTLQATVTASNHVQTVTVFFAVADRVLGPALTDYVGLPMTGTEPIFAWTGPTASVSPALAFSDPQDFHSVYLRSYVLAQDQTGAAATLPAAAGPNSDNAAFTWDNVLPSTAVADLSEVRAEDENNVPLYLHHAVRVEGIVTSAKETFLSYRTNFFIRSLDGQDAIRIYDPTVLSVDIVPGDLVRVTGRVGVYSGLRQIGDDQRTGTPAVTIELIAHGAPPQPAEHTISDLLAAPEELEAQFVRIHGVTISSTPAQPGSPPSTWPGDTTLYANDGTGQIPVRIAGNIDLVGQPAPSGAFDLQGIYTQYDPQGMTGYQLQPRGIEDVVIPGQVDAGVDAGVEPSDAGTDSGGEPSDAAVPQDSGASPDATAKDDSGTDAGEQTKPDGSATDSGELSGDDAAIDQDTGVNPTESDAAVATSADASGGRDVLTWGSSGSGTTSTNKEEGCSCNAVEHHQRGGTLFAAITLPGLLMLLAVGRRRRHERN